MSRIDDVFKPALAGKKVPILVLDNKWYKLISVLDVGDDVLKTEESLKEALKSQGRINSRIKDVRKIKKKLMNDIVGNMDTADGNDDIKEQIEECNMELDKCQEELLDVVDSINFLNNQLMLETMSLCYDALDDYSNQINEISDWINSMRIELKKNIVRKQEREYRNYQMYSYMHDIFGPEVIDIFDMKYNPEYEHVLIKKEEKMTDK